MGTVCGAAKEAALDGLEEVGEAVTKSLPFGVAVKLHVTAYKATIDTCANDLGHDSWCECDVRHKYHRRRPLNFKTKAHSIAQSSHEWYESFLVRWHEGDELEFTVYGSSAFKSWVRGKVTVPSEMFWPDGFTGDLQLTGPESQQGTLTVKIQPAKVALADLTNISGHYFDPEKGKYIHIEHRDRHLDITYGHRQICGEYADGTVTCSTMNSVGYNIDRTGTVSATGDITFSDGSTWVTSKAGLRKVVHIHGLASCSMQVKALDSNEWSLNWINFAGIAAEREQHLRKLRLRVEDVRMADGSTAPCVIDSEDSEIRPCRGLAGISTLGHGKLGGISKVIPEVVAWQGLLESLQSCYHQVPFNYDWRKFGCPRYSSMLVDNFRAEAEAAIEEGVGAIDVIAHSMGACVALYCLSILGEEWQKKHIDQVILIAPAVMGSPSMVPSWACNPIYASKAAAYLPDVLVHEAGETSATWVSFPFLFPNLVGGVNTYPPNYPIVVTPKRQYTVEQMGELIGDLADQVKDRDLGLRFWKSIMNIHAHFLPPAVHTYLIYTNSQDTPSQLTYGDDLGLAPEITEYKPGDGTIIAENIVKLGTEWRAMGADVTIVNAPGHTDHSSLISCDFVCKEVHLILDDLQRKNVTDLT